MQKVKNRVKKEPVTKSDLKKVETAIRKEIKGVETKLSKRIDGVETRLGRVETRLGRVETRLGRVETRLGRVETRLGRVETRLDKVEKSIDMLASQVAENTVRLDNMVTREEFNQRMDEITTTLDKMMGMLQVSKQERVFANQRISRNEGDIKRLEEAVFR